MAIRRQGSLRTPREIESVIDQQRIAEIKRRISREFPEFKGIEPKITEKKIRPQDSIFKKLLLGRPKQFVTVIRLKFEKKVETVDHTEIERILVVSLDEQGEIIKITESR